MIGKFQANSCVEAASILTCGLPYPIQVPEVSESLKTSRYFSMCNWMQLEIDTGIITLSSEKNRYRIKIPKLLLCRLQDLRK
jgi:hypothetical protein